MTKVRIDEELEYTDIDEVGDELSPTQKVDARLYPSHNPYPKLINLLMKACGTRKRFHNMGEVKQWRKIARALERDEGDDTLNCVEEYIKWATEMNAEQLRITFGTALKFLADPSKRRDWIARGKSLDEYLKTASVHR